MGVFNQLAIAFQYPTTKSFEQLENNMEEFADGPIKSSYVLFWNKIRNLSLSQFEELYTRTLDLNPSAAPYIGFQIWGESYQRGEFLALMNHALRNAEVDLHGELSDHLLHFRGGQAFRPKENIFAAVASAQGNTECRVGFFVDDGIFLR